MIKILHIAKPLSGVGVYISLLAKYIDEDQFSNSIICDFNDKIISIKNSKNVKIDHFHCNIKREINILNDIKSIFKIIKIIKKENPDIIHCHSAKTGILGRIAGKLLNVKTVYTPHAYSYLSAESNKKKYVLKKIEYIFGFFYGYTLACSKSEQKRAINDLKIKKEKVLLWQNSIENKIEVKKTDYLDKLPKDFICSIGRPSYQKNTLLLVKAILIAKKKKNDIHLVILGVGFHSPKLKEVEDFIEKNNLTDNINLIPWLSRAESMAILQKSLFYISSSRYEGLPYSVIEALAFEKPCLLTKVDGNKDLITNNYNGYLVEESELEMGVKIIDIITNKKLLKKMSINSRVIFENFYDIKKNIKSLENLYLRL
jgi:glycosyltransferase involved in cell wall biosynthesis